jgi:hypothetical protein
MGLDKKKVKKMLNNLEARLMAVINERLPQPKPKVEKPKPAPKKASAKKRTVKKK